MSEDKEAPSRIQIAMDASDKNKLRKEFNHFTALNGITKKVDEIGDTNEVFEWFYTKLKNQAEEKDAELSSKNRALQQSERIRQSDWKELQSQIEQLKAELSRKEEMLKALEGIERLCDNQNPSHESIWRLANEAVQKYKTLTNGD